jgi:hypothetical protein
MTQPGQLHLFNKDRHRKPKVEVLPKLPECKFQMNLIEFLKLQARKEIEYFHVPNGEQRDKRQGAKLKAMGVRPGVSDLIFIMHDTSEVPVLFLELKVRNGKLTDDQKHFRDRVTVLGYVYEWADSFDEAVRILRKHHVLRTNHD